MNDTETTTTGPHTRYKCPKCSKQMVTLQAGRPQDDSIWACGKCDWYAFADFTDKDSAALRQILADTNPGMTIWISGPRTDKA